MSIQIFQNPSSQWDVFLPKSTSFATLVDFIHTQAKTSQVTNINYDIRIYLGKSCILYNFEIIENFEILLDHSAIKHIQFIVDNRNPQFESLQRAIKFMHDVYEYDICLIGVRSQIIQDHSEDS